MDLAALGLGPTSPSTVVIHRDMDQIGDTKVPINIERRVNIIVVNVTQVETATETKHIRVTVVLVEIGVALSRMTETVVETTRKLDAIATRSVSITTVTTS
jgi:hypothetical protein